MKNYCDLFVRYLENDLKGKELDSFLQWMKNPANAAEVETLIRNDWKNFDPQIQTTISPKESFETFRKKIHNKPVPRSAAARLKQVHPKRSLFSTETRLRLVRIAASLILPAAIGLIAYQLGKHSMLNPGKAFTFNEISVPLGSKTQVELSDGTKIWLNAGSKLKYPQHFTGSLREVELTGEGYFDVAKNPSRPFIVKTSDINIRVLGTTFNVKAYPDEGTIETTLVKGAITITRKNKNGSGRNEISLKPKERATYIKEKGKIILSEVEKNIEKQPEKTIQSTLRKEHMIFAKNVDTEQFTAWKDNKLIFKNEDFESLCIKLERWYNVKINLKSKDLTKFHYSGVIENETVNDVIRIIQLTMPIEYSIDHSVIDIWNKKDKKQELKSLPSSLTN